MIFTSSFLTLLPWKWYTPRMKITYFLLYIPIPSLYKNLPPSHQLCYSSQRNFSSWPLAKSDYFGSFSLAHSGTLWFVSQRLQTAFNYYLHPRHPMVTEQLLFFLSQCCFIFFKIYDQGHRQHWQSQDPWWEKNQLSAHQWEILAFSCDNCVASLAALFMHLSLCLLTSVAWNILIIILDILILSYHR